jgi:hypothetical protein
MSNHLVCNSFNDQYKKIQSFRNQYLNMIRLVLKHKNNLTFEQIMEYNMIESKINDVLYDIKNYTSEIKSVKTKNQYMESIHPQHQQHQQDYQSQSQSYNHDTTMVETLAAFLPYMILYYNHLQTVSLLSIPLD